MAPGSRSHRALAVGSLVTSAVALMVACGRSATGVAPGDGGGDGVSGGEAAPPGDAGAQADALAASSGDATVDAVASVDGGADSATEGPEAGSGGDSGPGDGEAGTLDAADAGDRARDAGADVDLDGASDAGAPSDAGATPLPDAATACGPCTGTVVAGRCVETLATGQTGPYAIATDGVDVYWTSSGNYVADAGSVMRVSVCGGAPVPISSGVTAAGGIAVDGRRVYWTEETSVETWTKSTGAIAALATDQPYPDGIAIDGTNIYFTTDVSDGGILRVPLDGGAPTTIVPHLGNPVNLVLSPTRVYWIGLAGDSVYYAPLGGGSQQTFFYDSNYSIAAIAIDTANIYYTEQSSLGPLGVLPLDGAAPTSIANDNGTFGVVSDGTYVYYASPDGDAPNFDGEVMRVPIAGGTPTTLATGGHPEAIAIDATSVYWTSSRSQIIGKASPR